MASNAFGENGWLREKKNGKFEHVEEEDFLLNTTNCYYVPNLVAIISNTGKVQGTVKRLEEVFKAKNMKTTLKTDMFDGIFVVALVGHFFLYGPKRGQFNAGSPVQNIFELRKATKYKIGAFIGLGCYSSLYRWHKIVARGEELTWDTDYRVNISELEDASFSDIYSRYDPLKHTSKTKPGLSLEGTGNDGESLESFLKKIF